MAVEFFEENESMQYKSRKIIGVPTTPPTFNLLLKTGLAKNVKQAYLMLATLCLIFFGISVYLLGGYVVRAYKDRPSYDPRVGLSADQKKSFSESAKNTLFPQAK